MTTPSKGWTNGLAIASLVLGIVWVGGIGAVLAVVFGFVGQTEAIVARMKAELGAGTTVVATGGLAEIVARQTRAVDAVEPHLVLEGLRLYYERRTLRERAPGAAVV